MDAVKLDRELSGRVLVPGDAGFDEARALWNGRFDRRPDLVAVCSDAEDVRASIGFARGRGLRVSVKGGGHSYAAKTVADGGVLIDLSAMKSIRVDVGARTVSIGPGVTCAELDAATQRFGLATPTPTVSSVGAIGAALGGGGGYLSRKYGLMVDNIVSAEVITADGKLIRASAEDQPDLFWALRGGGGNFGVVTTLELRLHEVGPEVLAGQIVYPFDRAGELLRVFRDFMAAAPNEFQCYPFCFKVPPIDAFPERTHGSPVLDFVLFHEDAEATEFVRPLRELGEPILDVVGPSRYVDVQKTFDPNMPKGLRYYSKAHDLDSLSDGAIDTMVELVPSMVGALTAAYFDPVGGAIGRVDRAATPYAGRQATFGFHCIAGWIDPSEDESVLEWASRFGEAVATHANGGVYVNLIADDETDRVSAAYGENLDRLTQLKLHWDPDNVFSGNYNILPG